MDKKLFYYLKCCLVLMCLTIPNTVFGYCLDYNVPDHACRYTDGDNWCRKNRQRPFAYLGKKKCDHPRPERPTLTPPPKKFSCLDYDVPYHHCRYPSRDNSCQQEVYGKLPFAYRTKCELPDRPTTNWVYWLVLIPVIVIALFMIYLFVFLKSKKWNWHLIKKQVYKHRSKLVIMNYLLMAVTVILGVVLIITGNQQYETWIVFIGLLASLLVATIKLFKLPSDNFDLDIKVKPGNLIRSRDLPHVDDSISENSAHVIVLNTDNSDNNQDIQKNSGDFGLPYIAVEVVNTGADIELKSVDLQLNPSDDADLEIEINGRVNPKAIHAMSLTGLIPNDCNMHLPTNHKESYGTHGSLILGQVLERGIQKIVVTDVMGNEYFADNSEISNAEDYLKTFFEYEGLEELYESY